MVALSPPFISSLYPGFVVPIPMFPSSLIKNAEFVPSETLKSPVAFKLNDMFPAPLFINVSDSEPSWVIVVSWVKSPPQVTVLLELTSPFVNVRGAW